jgi:hypothetical protein
MQQVSETEDIQVPAQFSHSIKLSDTAKRVRVDVHVYATNRSDAIMEALKTYKEMNQALTESKIQIAPVEIKA